MGAYDVNQAEIFRNGFLDAFNVVQAGGQSPLINQMFEPDSGRQPDETGSDFMRRIYRSQLNQNAVGTVAERIARRTEGGVPLVEAAGFSPFFFFPYPQFAGRLRVFDSNDFSTYHAAQISLDRRFDSGFSFQTAYTFSKSLDTRSFDPTLSTVSTGSSQSASSTPFDVLNRRLNFARSDFDRTHVLQANWVYELPFGRGRRFGSSLSRGLDMVLGGWQVAGLTRWTSGRPFTVYSGAETLGNIVQSPAECNGCPRDMGTLFDNEDGVKFFFSEDELSRFSIPAAGSLGNSGRNYFNGPGFFTLDASLLKRTALTERFLLELRADATNLTNTPSFGFPTARITSSSFGRVRDNVVSEARQIMLGMKLRF
jgi:hypothetical protein